MGGDSIELVAVVSVFLLFTYKDLLNLKTFSLNREEDLFLIRVGLGMIALALVVAGIDRFVQWIEVLYEPEIFHLNDLLASIPFNDLSEYFNYDIPFLLPVIRAVYHYGFFVPFVFLLLRGIAKRDVRSLSMLVFGTFAFHYVVHFPFYFLTEGHQIWYVKGIMVPLFRTVSPLDHVFPSMHTSMAVTYLLLAWQQPNKRIRVLYTVFCPMIVFGTFYLQIHWTIDAVAGAIIGIAAFKFAKYATDRGWLYPVMAKLTTLLPVRRPQTGPRRRALSRG